MSHKNAQWWVMNASFTSSQRFICKCVCFFREFYYLIVLTNLFLWEFERNKIHKIMVLFFDSFVTYWRHSSIKKNLNSLQFFEVERKVIQFWHQIYIFHQFMHAMILYNIENYNWFISWYIYYFHTIFSFQFSF